MHDLGEAWEQTVLMSGSGPACFGFFLDVGEAEDALDEVGENPAAKAADLRTRGVGRPEDSVRVPHSPHHTRARSPATPGCLRGWGARELALIPVIVS